MLALLLTATDEAGQPLTDTEIRDELVTFLLASHETAANALTWTWLLLSQSSAVRARLTHTVAARAKFQFINTHIQLCLTSRPRSPATPHLFPLSNHGTRKRPTRTSRSF